MDNTEAWLYAASWGSYMRAGDPGACMYGFDERFAVQSEGHRAEVLAWIDERCIPQVKTRPSDYDPDELDRLAALREKVLAASMESNQ